jgi:hypothetical protein
MACALLFTETLSISLLCNIEEDQVFEGENKEILS